MRFGRVERFKDSGQHFFRNRLTRIFDLEFHTLGRWTATANRNLSPNGRGIDRVEQQVQECSLQLLTINIRLQARLHLSTEILILCFEACTLAISAI